MSFCPLPYPKKSATLCTSVRFPVKEANVPNKAFSRAVRKSHILMSFINRYRNGKEEEVTSSQVARALMLEPSGHVRGLLAELVKDGVLEARLVDNPRSENLIGGHSQVCYYKLSESQLKEMDENSRLVTIKINGLPGGQIRLF